MSELVLRVDGLVAGYGPVTVVHDVSLSVPRGAIVSIIGPNGAGKSTLLKGVYGLVDVSGGQVLFRPAAGEQVDLTGLRPDRITAAGLNYAPQLANVFPNLTVFENLEMGAVLRRDAMDERLEVVYELFPLLEERRQQRAGTLSGGQRQMLALARAMMTDPELLLLDEPSAGLAPRVIDEVMELLTEINRRGVSILMVEQNARRSLAVSDYGYVLEAGRNRIGGEGSTLLEDPAVVDLYLGG
ncbi:MAG: ABC transporter ATP-binding protein [Actinomycetota bacterium]